MEKKARAIGDKAREEMGREGAAEPAVERRGDIRIRMNNEIGNTEPSEGSKKQRIEETKQVNDSAAHDGAADIEMVGTDAHMVGPSGPAIVDSEGCI